MERQLNLDGRFDVNSFQNSYMYKYNFLRLIQEKLFDKISSSEMSILLFIFNRTIHYGKDEEVITYKQFNRGILKKDGTVVQTGTGISRKTVYRSLKNLTDKGIINKRDYINKNGDDTVLNYYSINKLYFNDLNTCSKAENNMKKKKTIIEKFGKKSRGNKSDLEQRLNGINNKQGKGEGLHRVKMTPPPCQNDTQNTNINISNNNSNNKVCEKSHTHSLHGETLTIKTKKDFQKTFDKLSKKYFDEFPIWNTKSLANLKRCLMKDLDSKQIEDVYDFINYVTYRWGQLMNKKFGWMKVPPPPASPDPQFLITHRAKFIESYLAKEVLLGKVVGDEVNNIYNEKIRAGADPDKAMEMALAEHQSNEKGISEVKVLGEQKNRLESKIEELERKLEMQEKLSEEKVNKLRQIAIDKQKQIDKLEEGEIIEFDEQTMERLKKQREQELKNGNN